MVVYEKNEQRLHNYQQLNSHLNDTITKFPAIDSINEFDKWKKYALQNSYCTQKYIDNDVRKAGKGKLGCNLSHLLLFKQLIDEYDSNRPDWYLILEDDVGIFKATNKDIDHFIESLLLNIKANSPDTQYMQLCVYDKFINKQLAAPRIFKSTYQKVPQYGTCAYLINIDAMRYIDKNKPWDINIDFLFNTLDRHFNALATLNPYFYNQGTESGTDDRPHKSFGSLIWQKHQIKVS